MTSARIISLTLSGILFFLAQVLILKNLVLFGVAFCFLYVMFIILLPIEVKTIPSLLVAFVLGLGVDMFYDTMGIHTAALLVLGFVRNRWLQVLAPAGTYDETLQPTVVNMGLRWFLSYSIPLVLIHHVIFFYVESLGTHMFWASLQKIFASIIFVLTVSIAVQLLFYRRGRGIL